MAKTSAFLRALQLSIAQAGSQDALARLSGIPQGTISRWLTGKVRKFPLDAPARFERATRGKVKATEFFG